jgi:pimeloyl-ACP methyl ester carboxylesterase
MLRRLFAILLLLVGLIAIAALVVPLLLVDPDPAPGEPRQVAGTGADLESVEIAVDGMPGLRLHVRDGGVDGAQPATSAFVLLHGFTFNLFTWDAVGPALRDQGRVIAYDQVPYGRSDKPRPGDWQDRHPYSRAAALERLFALMDRSGLERAILVGNSSGASLALDAARARPERVEALVLIAPWVFSQRPSLPGWLTGLPTMERVALALARLLGDDVPLLDRSYHRPDRISDNRRRLAGVHRETPGWDVAWAALLTRSLAERLVVADHLGDIDVPALVIAGAEDRIVPVADSRRAADLLPDATYVEIGGCGHVPQEECPDAVIAAIRDWLSRPRQGNAE